MAVAQRFLSLQQPELTPNPMTTVAGTDELEMAAKAFGVNVAPYQRETPLASESLAQSKPLAIHPFIGTVVSLVGYAFAFAGTAPRIDLKTVDMLAQWRSIDLRANCCARTLCQLQENLLLADQQTSLQPPSQDHCEAHLPR